MRENLEKMSPKLFSIQSAVLQYFPIVNLLTSNFALLVVAVINHRLC